MIRPHPDSFLNIRRRISNWQITNLDGCDVFSNFSSHKYLFYLATGETPESLLRLTRTIRHLFLNETGRNHTILPVNIVMLYMMWLRSYPSYHILALIFNVSVATVHNEINRCIPIIKRALEHCMQWPTINEWREKRSSWTKFENAVSVILIQHLQKSIIRKSNHKNCIFLVHRNFHAIHTQVVIENVGYICYAEARFLGHENDAKQFTNIGYCNAERYKCPPNEQYKY